MNDVALQKTGRQELNCLINDALCCFARSSPCTFARCVRKNYYYNMLTEFAEVENGENVLYVYTHTHIGTSTQ